MKAPYALTILKARLIHEKNEQDYWNNLLKDQVPAWEGVKDQVTKTHLPNSQVRIAELESVIKLIQEYDIPTKG